MGKAFTLLVLFLLSFRLLAQTNQLVLQTEQSEVKWAGSTALSYYTNLYERDSFDSTAGASFGLTLDYNAPKNNIIRSSLSVEKQLTQGQETKPNDGFVAWVNNSFWRRGKILTIGQQVRGLIPVSEESRNRDQKQFGIALLPTFVFNLTPVGLKGVSFVYIPAGVKNFHQFKQNRLFQNNVEYILSNTGVLTWGVTDKFYIQQVFTYGRSWSYGGNLRDDTYSFSTELGYSVKPSTILALGATNGGAIRNFENGNDQTIQLYDKRTVSVYSALYFVF